MDGRSWFSLPSMGQMLNESPKEELLKFCQRQRESLGAAVPDLGTEMIIIEIENTEGEAVVEVEAEGNMIVTSTKRGTEITVVIAAVVA